MVHATVPRSSSNFCNITTHYMHQTSSPNHPRSNGFAERMVGVDKKLMEKAGREGKGNHAYQVCLSTESHLKQAALHHLCN